MEEKVYQAPAIIYEGDLEVQAGSPQGAPPELNLLDVGSDNN